MPSWLFPGWTSHVVSSVLTHILKLVFGFLWLDTSLLSETIGLSSIQSLDRWIERDSYLSFTFPSFFLILHFSLLAFFLFLCSFSVFCPSPPISLFSVCLPSCITLIFFHPCLLTASSHPSLPLCFCSVVPLSLLILSSLQGLHMRNLPVGFSLLPLHLLCPHSEFFSYTASITPLSSVIYLNLFGFSLAVNYCGNV